MKPTQIQSNADKLQTKQNSYAFPGKMDKVKKKAEKKENKVGARERRRRRRKMRIVERER